MPMTKAATFSNNDCIAWNRTNRLSFSIRKNTSPEIQPNTYDSKAARFSSSPVLDLAAWTGGWLLIWTGGGFCIISFSCEKGYDLGATGLRAGDIIPIIDRKSVV